MSKLNNIIIVLFMFSILFVGCSDNKSENLSSDKINKVETTTDVSMRETIPPKDLPVNKPDLISEADWSEYFKGLTGSAVIYMPATHKYMIYNKELSDTKRSPCSTFKIISSLIGIEKGIIRTDDTLRKWSGEIFWNEEWNRDINFKDAFQTSCIWYFREVINVIEEEDMREQLNLLKYGNCDISDWEGHLNNNNNNRALTGFWLESSLKISPKEQTEVMERIFGEDSIYRPQTLDALKDAMLLTESAVPKIKIYGKTGMGKSNGITVDAWFTGFFEMNGEKSYFCVYIGQSDQMEVTSAEAKKIALQIINDKFTP